MSQMNWRAWTLGMTGEKCSSFTSCTVYVKTKIHTCNPPPPPPLFFFVCVCELKNLDYKFFLNDSVFKESQLLDINLMKHGSVSVMCVKPFLFIGERENTERSHLS